MASYSISWKASALKELKKIDKSHISSIIKAVESLTTHPDVTHIRKMQGTDHTFRKRVGNYRIIYSVVESELIIEVIRVRHRKEAYK